MFAQRDTFMRLNMDNQRDGKTQTCKSGMLLLFRLEITKIFDLGLSAGFKHFSLLAARKLRLGQNSTPPPPPPSFHLLPSPQFSRRQKAKNASNDGKPYGNACYASYVARHVLLPISFS